jgi:hypothetical protein
VFAVVSFRIRVLLATALMALIDTSITFFFVSQGKEEGNPVAAYLMTLLGVPAALVTYFFTMLILVGVSLFFVQGRLKYFYPAIVFIGCTLGAGSWILLNFGVVAILAFSLLPAALLTLVFPVADAGDLKAVHI